MYLMMCFLDGEFCLPVLVEYTVVKVSAAAATTPILHVTQVCCPSAAQSPRMTPSPGLSVRTQSISCWPRNTAHIKKEKKINGGGDRGSHYVVLVVANPLSPLGPQGPALHHTSVKIIMINFESY